MPESFRRKYFIVKHGLDAFEALPNFIWRTGKGPNDIPRQFPQVKIGGRWIAFAYTSSDRKEQDLSLITGFYRCTKEASYRDIPSQGHSAADEETKAWMIEGEEDGKQPDQPVGVPPVDSLLGRQTFRQSTLIEVTAEEFERIREEALRLQFDTTKIPLFGREPNCEQELLAIVASAHKKLGIEKILRVRTAFPDLLVQIEREPDVVHLELEVYSNGFFSHGHHEQVRNRRFKEDDKPVAVLCWIDNNRDVKDQVHRVYELRSLIREGKKIVW